jgi:hypothetical protein
MEAQEILSKVNSICWTKFSDINFSLLTNKKYFTKDVGDYEIVVRREYKGKEDKEVKTRYFIYVGKGLWSETIVHFIKYNIYIAERRWYVPKVKGGDCVDYQGSEFYEVKPKGKGFVNVEELC